MQQQPEIPSTPPVTPPPNPEFPQNYPPKKSKLWLWVTLAIVGVLATIGIVVAIVLASNKTTPSKDTNISRKEATKPKDEKKSEDKKQNLAKSNSKCLTSADFRKAGYSHMKEGLFVLNDGKYNLENIFFNADSSQYTYEGVTIDKLGKLGSLYKSNSQKEFSIELVGQTYESSKTSAGTKLAMERADKVKQGLVSQGFPENKIIISEPKIANHDSSDDTADRNVTIYLVVPQECSEK
ncbi:MAG: hypothetical protein NNC24_00305 [Candidatus Nanosynbacter sp. P11B_S7_bin.28.1]|nr:hypothetical protein [Candidatus Nanosynbacter sp. P11B_S7_bin.28.1]